ncbi:MAG: 50S ribosome-binding GTPase [Phycisphaerales bacterium]|nr:50S ribosome-binding GTPase [Planctomycetota bacterium]MCH8507215.1 50S ribosome-binding GTPase [Phycisphaerales bacterium]
MNARYAAETGGSRPGAVAVIRIDTEDADGFFRACAMAPVSPGASAVRRVLGLDEALVARPDSRTLFIMPHGGGAILRGVAEGLDRLGLRRAEGDAHRWPEARDAIEERMLGVLAEATSPRAVGLLLDQPRRWRAHDPGDGMADAHVLSRLIRPPLVAAVGGANIGKSSLLNAVSGASVALAFDRAGTTRDAVGVLVELDGLVVRWLDTPGIDALGTPAAMIALDGARQADLVLRCVDSTADASDPDPAAIEADLVVATRADRGRPGFRADAVTSASTGLGIAELARLIRSSLTPDAVLDDPRPWRFWDAAAQA